MAPYVTMRHENKTAEPNTTLQFTILSGTAAPAARSGQGGKTESQTYQSPLPAWDGAKGCLWAVAAASSLACWVYLPIYLHQTVANTVLETITEQCMPYDPRRRNDKIQECEVFTHHSKGTALNREDTGHCFLQ